MMVTNRPQKLPHEEFVLLRDDEVGLDGIIAIHSTARGPAAGGCRIWKYGTADALRTDAARLAEGMSYKNAMADLPLGGGKAVLRLPEGSFDRRALFSAFGREIKRLGGTYVTAEDVGTSVADMEAVARETIHVAGLPARAGRPGGDPSAWTARGVLVSMRYAAEHQLGRALDECTVAIQGVGHVGEALAMMLHAQGARLIISDINQQNATRVAVATGALVVSPESILGAEADILAPCALGGVLNASSIPMMRAKLVCGAANNQLETVEDGARLADAGCLYAPDYVVNAGGIINVAAEYLGWSIQDVTDRVNATGERLTEVFAEANRAALSPNLAADALARDRIAAAAIRTVAA